VAAALDSGVSGDPLGKRQRILEREPWASMRVTGFIEPRETRNWSIRTFVVPQDDPSQRHEMLHMGRYVPPGVEFTALLRKDRLGPDGRASLVMSDTPDELTDHAAIIKRVESARAPIRVLVNGLGLGCVLKGLLSFKQVAHLDVVEIDWDLISIVGPYYLGRRIGRRPFRGRVRSMDRRLSIHHSDAFKKKWTPDTRWHLVWHDVWDSVDPGNLSDEARAVPGTYDALLSKYAARCEWQGAWGEDLLRPPMSRG
jgi:hypothetical protein